MLEDEVPQAIGSFALINRGVGIGIGVKFKQPDDTTLIDASAPKPANNPELEAVPASTAIIFDALSPDALVMSQRAALDYLPADGASHTRVAIFATVPSMQIVQGYTDDIAVHPQRHPSRDRGRHDGPGREEGPDGQPARTADRAREPGRSAHARSPPPVAPACRIPARRLASRKRKCGWSRAASG